MGPELENKQNTDMILLEAKKENDHDTKELDASLVSCANNNDDHTSLVDKVVGVHGSEDVAIDIVECTNSADNMLVESDREEMTESSSSFGSVTSGAENCTTLSDAECTSEYNGHATSELAFSGFGDFRIRRKKTSSHWREFTRSHRHLCKLIELKLHMLQSQARKYEKQMQILDHQKQLQQGSVQLEGLGSKSLPFSCNGLRDNIMKRKKRRRIEDTLDISAYMSHHPLFSFFEKRKSIADDSFLDDKSSKIAICSDKINADDEFLIQDDLHQQPAGHTSLEKVLCKIGVLQSQISQLKTRLDKVTSENVGIFSSTDDLKSLQPCNALASSAQSSASLLDNRVKRPVGAPRDAVSELISEYNMVKPNSGASSCGDILNVPDVMGSTYCSFLLGTNTHLEDDILIYNKKMNEEMSNFQEFKIHSAEEPKVLEREKKGTDSAGLPNVDIPVDDQPAPKIRSIAKLISPTSKKRKARQRAGRRNY